MLSVVTRHRRESRWVGSAAEVPAEREQAERELARAEAHRQEAIARLESVEVRAADLAEQQSVIRGEMEIAQRAVSDFTDAILPLQHKLAAIRAEEAREQFAAALRRRDDAVAEAAVSIDATLTLLAQLDEHRRNVVDAAASLQATTGTPESPTTEEPSVLDAPLQRLMEFARTRSDEQLLDDAVTAAATSLRGFAIKDLPAHLQELARERRRTLHVTPTPDKRAEA
jgi:chromosome segregation ATPase